MCHFERFSEDFGQQCAQRSFEASRFGSERQRVLISCLPMEEFLCCCDSPRGHGLFEADVPNTDLPRSGEMSEDVMNHERIQCGHPMKNNSTTTKNIDGGIGPAEIVFSSSCCCRQVGSKRGPRPCSSNCLLIPPPTRGQACDFFLIYQEGNVRHSENKFPLTLTASACHTNAKKPDIVPSPKSGLQEQPRRSSPTPNDTSFLQEAHVAS